MRRDPYQVLGVARDSGPAEWKRAYRRLAMRWHPDRSTHPEATERFKEINAAYEAIAAVDCAAPDETAEARNEEARNDKAGASAGVDIRLNLELTLEEAFFGCRKTLSYHRGHACTTCQGTGQAGMLRTRFCAACHGSGRVRQGSGGLRPCSDCGGRGFFSERICPDCRGSGRDSDELSLEVQIPPGMLPGDDLRLVGQGEAADAQRAAGDLYLTLVLRQHPLFRLNGRDLHCRMPVSALALLGGGGIRLPVIGGSLQYELAPGPVEPRSLRLAGLGFPGRGKIPAGDLCIELTPVFPTTLDARQRKLLQQLDAALQASLPQSLPEIAAWRAEHGFDAA